MSDRIVVNQDAVEPWRASMRSLIKQAGLPALFGDVDGGAYGLTHEELDLLGAIESGLAVMAAGVRALATRWPARSGRVLTRIYAVFVGATRAVEAMPPGRARAHGHFDLAAVQRMLDGEPADESLALAESVLADYMQYVEFYRNHPDREKRVDSDETLTRCTLAYFTLLASTVRLLGADPIHAANVGDVTFEVFGQPWAGFGQPPCP